MSHQGRDAFADLVIDLTSGEEPGRRFTAESLRTIEEVSQCPDVLPRVYCKALDVPRGTTYAEAIERRGLLRIPVGTSFEKANEMILDSAGTET